MNDERTTGTTPQDGGDAGGSPTTGTPAGAGRDAGSDEPDYKAMYLDAKGKVEEANRLKAEIEDLRARAQQPPAADDDDDDEGGSGDGVDWRQVEDYANRGDMVAKAQLANRKLSLELARNVRDSFHLRDIDDKSEREEVLRHYAKNRHRLGDVKAAEAEIRKRKLEAENERLRKELDAARKQPPQDVVRTHSREVPASEAKTRTKTTFADFDREQAELRAAGKHREAMDRQMQLARGELEAE